LHKENVAIYSQVVHEPSGIRRFWFGVSLLSPLRPILLNGNQLVGNAFHWRAHSPESHPKSPVGNRPAENALPDFFITAVVPGLYSFSLSYRQPLAPESRAREFSPFLSIRLHFAEGRGQRRPGLLRVIKKI